MRFSDFVTLQRGFDLPKTQMRDGPYPVLGSTSIIGHHDEFKVEPPGVVTGRSGSLGVVQYVDQRFWPHNTALWVKDFKGNDPRFVYYAMKALDFARFNAGAGVPTLNRNHLDALEVQVPSLGIQKRIAEVLSAYDELIENSQRRIQILESMARTLYREWFVHFRFPGHESVPHVLSPFGKIPQGWGLRYVKELATVVYGFPFASKKFNNDGVGTPIIRIRDILQGSSATYTEEEAEPRYHVKDGHILVGMDGDFHMCIWSGGHAFQNQRVARFGPSAEIGNFHLFLALEKPIQEFNKAIVGTTVAHLGDMHVKMIQIVWPSARLRALAREVLEPMSEQIIDLKRQIQNLRRTRDLLLPRLLSGQIDVEAIAA